MARFTYIIHDSSISREPHLLIRPMQIADRGRSSDGEVRVVFRLLLDSC